MQIKQTKVLETIFNAAKETALDNGFKDVSIDHLFLAILNHDGGHASHILRKSLKDWEIYQIKSRIEHFLGQPAVAEYKAKNAGLEGYNEIDTLLRMSIEFGAPKENTLNSACLLRTISADRRSLSSRVLNMYGVTPEIITQFIDELPAEEDYYDDMDALNAYNAESESSLEGGAATKHGLAKPDTKKSPLSETLIRFGVDLTQSALDGKLDPVVGRDKEIERLVQILGRRKKNNPVLIGEPGVGKSAIVDGLALRIMDKKVPYTLLSKRVLVLDVASLVAGTKYRGEFEERIKALLDELRENQNVILFIDEIHTIVGAGSTQGSLDTANVLKPALARGELQCIGATTLDEYRENIEKDGALERRFQKIIVEQPSAGETLEVLRNIKSQYEQHHCVSYTDEALKACVNLTQRYITDRFFPDKAIDVMDEAGSRARLRGLDTPQDVIALEQELAAVCRSKQEAAERQDFESAAELRNEEKNKREELCKAQELWAQSLKTNPVTVDQEQIAEVVSIMTGIPSQNLSDNEQEQLRGLNREFEEVVIGHNEAVHKVTRAILRSRAGLKDPNRPIGVFMFTGPTGVGKTHLAKELAHKMFRSDDALIRIDMSEYTEKHNVSRLIGSPPGYVGYGEGGQLTEKVRRRPYAVLLFDEIEKAHPDVFNVMLQIFDEGQLTDGQGRKVDFRNTVIIMTSNVGSTQLASKPRTPGYGTAHKESTVETQSRESVYNRSMEQMFAPEFLNRIDEIVMFNPLSEDNIYDIVSLELRELERRLSDLGYTIELSESAKRALVEISYDARYGARALKRTIIDKVESPIAEMIVEGEVKAGDVILAERSPEGGISLSVKHEQPGPVRPARPARAKAKAKAGAGRSAAGVSARVKKSA